MCPLTFWPQSKIHTCSFTFLLHDKSHALSFSFSHAVLHFSHMITVMRDLWHCPHRERTTTANSCCKPPWCWGARFATPWNRTTSSRVGWRKPGNGSHRAWTRGPTVSQCPLCFWQHLTRYLSPAISLVQFNSVNSVQGGISALEKACMCSTPSLRSFPEHCLWNHFGVGLIDDGLFTRPFKENCGMLPLGVMYLECPFY